MAGRETLDHRRHAVQVVASLPEDTEDALIILRLATRLVNDFLAEPEPVPKPAPIIALVREPPHQA